MSVSVCGVCIQRTNFFIMVKFDRQFVWWRISLSRSLCRTFVVHGILYEMWKIKSVYILVDTTTLHEKTFLQIVTADNFVK